MALPLPHPDESLEPDISHLVTEDDSPVDSVYSEKQMRLLTHVLHTSWKPGRDFVAFANVGLFPLAENPAIVPDVMVSLDVKLPPDIHEKGSRSYMVWRYGKPPDLVVEIVSNSKGDELEKVDAYARIGVGYYILFDPEGWLGTRALRAFVLHGRKYVDLVDCSWIEEIGLGLKLWTGPFEDWTNTWLRWCDREGTLLPTAEEHALLEQAQADEQRARAEAAESRAEASEARLEAERARADRLQARLRELGLDQDP